MKHNYTFDFFLTDNAFFVQQYVLRLHVTKTLIFETAEIDKFMQKIEFSGHKRNMELVDLFKSFPTNT